MQRQFNGAPVVDEDGKLIGLFTKSHVYRVINNCLDMNTPIASLMTTDILTGHADDEFDQVVNPYVPRFPVVDENNHFIGIITRGDIAKAFFNSYQKISLELDTIINSAHNVIVSIDEKGIIKVWNSSAERLLGGKSEKAYTQYKTTRQMAKHLKVDASTIVRKTTKYGITTSPSNQ